MTIRQTIYRFLQTIALLTFANLIGIVGFMLIEGMSFVDALYMTVITVSTVGFETVTPLSTAGKLFVVFLIIFTLGAFFYAVTTLTTFIVEGEIRNIYKRYRVNKEISKLKDHVIICGLGRNGKEVVLGLQEDNIQHIIIEEDKEVIEDYLQSHKCLVLQGDATTEEMLINANIATARGVIACLPDDAANVFVTLTARELNSNAQIVAKGSSESTISKLRTAGANKVVLPTMIGGRKMAHMLTKPALVEFIETFTGDGDSKLKLEEFICSSKIKIVNKSIKELRIKERSGVMVLGYRNGAGKMNLNPNADKVIESGDILFIIGTKEELMSFETIYGME